MHIQPKATIYDANLGLTDRVIRIAIGAALVVSFMVFQEAGSSVFAALALLAIPTVTTALLSWDPLYALLGISSNGQQRDTGFADSNVGTIDRGIRYGVSGAMVLSFLVLAPTPVGLSALLPLAAIVVFATAVTGWCPLYTLANLSTRPVRSGTVHGFTSESLQQISGHERKAA